MTLGVAANSAASSLYGLASPYGQAKRPGHVFEAKPDPKAPDHFTAQWEHEDVEVVNTPPAPTKHAASRAYLSVNQLRPVRHRIDIYV